MVLPSTLGELFNLENLAPIYRTTYGVILPTMTFTTLSPLSISELPEGSRMHHNWDMVFLLSLNHKVG